MNNLNMIFHVVVSVYWLVKIWNSPQSPAEFRNSQYDIISHHGILCDTLQKANFCFLCVQESAVKIVCVKHIHLF